MILTVKETRRKVRPEPERKDVIECVLIGDLKQVQWHIQEEIPGDSSFPDWANLRFTDHEGKTAEIILGITNHSLMIGNWNEIRDRIKFPKLDRQHEYRKEKIKESDISALNKVLNYFDLLPGGKIIGVNWDVESAIKYAREKYPGSFERIAEREVCF